MSMNPPPTLVKSNGMYVHLYASNAQTMFCRAATELLRGTSVDGSAVHMACWDAQTRVVVFADTAVAPTLSFAGLVADLWLEKPGMWLWKAGGPNTGVATCRELVKIDPHGTPCQVIVESILLEKEPAMSPDHPAMFTGHIELEIPSLHLPAPKDLEQGATVGVLSADMPEFQFEFDYADTIVWREDQVPFALCLNGSQRLVVDRVVHDAVAAGLLGYKDPDGSYFFSIGSLACSRMDSITFAEHSP